MNPLPDTAPAWRADRRQKPLLAWRREQLATLSRKIDGVLAEWAAAWGIPPELCTAVACTPVDGGEAGPWQVLGEAGAGAAWTSSAESKRSQLAAALFGGATRTTPLVEEIAGACWNDALSRVRCFLALPSGGASSPGATTLSAWSGAVAAILPFGVHLLVTADVVGNLVAATAGARSAPAVPPPLRAIPEAISDRELKIQVQLEGCEIDIGALQDLQLGDVLRLRQGLDKPAAVRTADGAPVFNGFLVRSRGRKAIELACVTQETRALP